MKNEVTIKGGAVRATPVGLAGLAGRILAGAVALLLISAAFGGRAWAISGGEVDEDNTYSNVGGVIALEPGLDPAVKSSCILIHPRVVLTAGHVSVFMEQNPWAIPLTRISFGPYALDPSTWHEVEAVITHPNYSPIGSTSQNACDVGVIILKQPVNTRKVPVATLPRTGFLDDLNAAGLLRTPGEGGAPFKVAGYGGILTWPPPAPTYPGDGWRRFADSDYLDVLPGWLHLLQNPATGNGGTVYGDSGGPAFWIEPDGTRVLVGVTSWGDPKCLAMGFYWRVDIPETLDFIAQVIAGLEK